MIHGQKRWIFALNGVAPSHGVIFHPTDELLARPNMTIGVTTKAASVPLTATKLDSDGSTPCADIAKLP